MRRLCLLALVLASSRTARADPPAKAFTFLTYNLEFDNPDPNATLEAIADADPDVAIFQEVDAAWRDALIARLGTRYPYSAFHVYHRIAGGTAVMSKLPIEGDQVLPAIDWFPAQRFIVKSPFGAVQVLNVHLRPALDHGSWVRGYATTPPIRRREIEGYAKALAPELPTIVAGDFNEEPTGSAVALLVAQGFVRAVPTGAKTWHYEVTLLRKKRDVLSLDLDHIMVRHGVVARDAHVLEVGTSDHRPVVATLTAP